MSKTFIHPTACVEDGAIIGEGCYIGPFCLIRKNVVLGKNNTLHSHVVIDGPSEIGDGNEFFQFCSIGAKTQDLKYVGEPTYAKIGNNNCFRESVTIHRGTAPNEYTIIGDSCNLLAYCHVAHNCTLGNNIVMSNGVNLAGHVNVSNRAILGGMSAVHQFCCIGSMAMVGAASKIVQDVMPFCIADGAPASIRIINKIGLERNGVSKSDILEITRAFKQIFRSGETLEKVCGELKEKYSDNCYVKEMIDFALSSERGLTR